MEDQRKIAFIICSNDRRELQECLYYIRRLQVPAGMELETVVIKDAVSMTEGYNRAMAMTDARYKIYLHQDSFLIDSGFLLQLINIFQSDSKIGMVGAAGCRKDIASGVYYNSWDISSVYENLYEIRNHAQTKEDECLEDAAAVDGVLIATQYDIPWREDLFTGWDYYDVSQSFEFRRRGYRIVVPYQRQIWCWHDMETCELRDYWRNRDILAAEYQDIFSFEREYQTSFNFEQDVLLQEFTDLVKQLIRQGERHQVEQMMTQYAGVICSKTDLIVIANLVDVDRIEQSYGVRDRLWAEGDVFEQLSSKLSDIKFALKREEYEADENCLREIAEQGRYSHPALLAVAGIYIRNRESRMKVCNHLADAYAGCGKLREAEEVRRMGKVQQKPDENKKAGR